MTEELRTLFRMVSQYEHLTIKALAATMFIAVICALLIYLVYRFFHRGVVYSDNFAVLIVMVTVTTAFIITTIGANLVLSLGMVGALSIVRFRAAIKEPLDIGFLFLAIFAGLSSGSRLYVAALFGTFVICSIYVLMSFIKREKRNFLLILRYKAEYDEKVDGLLEALVYEVKNKAFSNDEIEMTLDVYLLKNKTDILKPFIASGIITDATLVEYNGDYA